MLKQIFSLHISSSYNDTTSETGYNLHGATDCWEMDVVLCASYELLYGVYACVHFVVWGTSTLVACML